MRLPDLFSLLKGHVILSYCIVLSFSLVNGP